jgi:hypothetical protein
MDKIAFTHARSLMVDLSRDGARLTATERTAFGGVLDWCTRKGSFARNRRVLVSPDGGRSLFSS